MNLKVTKEQRIASIEAFARDVAPPGYEPLIGTMKADGHSTREDIALAIVSDLQAKRERAEAAIYGRGAVAGHLDLAAVESDAMRVWESSPTVRAEFAGDRGAYVALRKAEAKGCVAFHGGARRR